MQQVTAGSAAFGIPDPLLTAGNKPAVGKIRLQRLELFGAEVFGSGGTRDFRARCLLCPKQRPANSSCIRRRSRANPARGAVEPLQSMRTKITPRERLAGNFSVPSRAA